MIISHIIGGIGNQMFQYAAGRALSHALGVGMRLDISDFSRYRIHQGFEVGRVFQAPVALADAGDVRAMLGWRAPQLVRRALRRPEMKWLRGGCFVAEPYFGYWPALKEIRCDAYLMGNWQSEEYFLECEDLVRQDFRFREPVTGQNAELLAQIRSVNAVSLHIRRGDYVSNGKTNAVHGVCSPDYYRRAVAHMVKHVDAPLFFIFSDDMDWVRSNFALEFDHRFVFHNTGAESYNDMRLMSACRHHVIANSSFSWWGAWLNANRDKMVVAPERWFANGMDARALFCSGWVLL